MSAATSPELAEPPRLPPGLVAPNDFRRLYDEHVAFVHRTLRRFGVPPASLDDAMQDVFSIVFSKLGGFEGRSSIKTWIFGIARRVARNHRPNHREHVDTSYLEHLVEVGTHAGSSLERIEGVRLLYRLLSELSPERREVFLLIELEQFTLQEAAQALDENPNTLSSRLRSARQELQDRLARARAHENWRAGCDTSA